MNELHEANRQAWNNSIDWWRELRERDQLWKHLRREPELAFEGRAFEMIRQYVGEMREKRVCVIGSGDNYAAFALAGSVARVTSVDISEEQLRVAADRAAELGLEIEFVRADASTIETISEGVFDLVFSSNGFYVWITEPARVLSEVHRILRPGGHYIFYDIHPFQRPWKEQIQPLEMEKTYWETGPFVESRDNGDTTYEYNWTLADLLNPLLESGLTLQRIAESPPADSRFWEGPSYGSGTDDSLSDWRNNPRAGLPAWLTVVAQKP